MKMGMSDVLRSATVRGRIFSVFLCNDQQKSDTIS